VRIAQVSPYSLTLPGGVQAQVLGLGRALRKLGHDVLVLGPCDGPPPEPGVVPLGSSIPLAANGSVAPIAPDISAVLRTMRALRDEGFDIVHIHEPLVPGPAATALVVADAPIVATFHRAGRSSAYSAFMPVTRYGVRKAAIRCAVSEDARRTAEEALGGEYVMVFNGIEVDRFAKAAPTPTHGHPTIFFLGRHEPRKGLEVLLHAMPALGPDVRLWVAGDGPQTNELRQQVLGDPRIEWLGRVTDAEVASRLAGADVFCAPSLGGESFGVVLLEAMAARTPIVASDLPGYRRVVRPGGEGLLVPPGDVDALSDALRTVLTDDAVRARLADACAERAESFSMDTLAERYLELYEEAAGHRATSARRAAGRRPRLWPTGRRAARSRPATGEEAGLEAPG
jgi:phosphatidylinositol alpha-mannosyltransferase